MSIKLLHGDCRDVLKTLADASVHACITSPPYYALRSYLDADHPDKHREIGSERSPEDYLATMVQVFREVKRVLRNDGVMFCNMGDAYSNKQLQMMPARLAIALQADGWWLRSMLPWLKRSAMPESVTDRPASAVEYVFLLTKSSRYFWDQEACKRGSDTRLQQRLTPTYEQPKGAARIDAGLHMPGCQGGTSSSRNMRNSDLFYDSLGISPGPSEAIRRQYRQTDYGGQSTKGHDAAGVQNPGDVKRRVLAGMQARIGVPSPAPLPLFDGDGSEPLGLITDADGSPLALDVNPAAFSEWAQTSRQVYVASDADVDGKKRKASPDCPVHADQPAQAPSARRDAHAASSDLFHNLGNDSDPETGLADGSEPSALLHEQEIGARSSGFPLPAHSLSATPHSNQSRRMDPALATSPPCIVSAQTADHTADTSGLRDPVDSAGRTCWSSSAASGSPDGQTTQMACDSVHIPDEAASSSASSAPKCTCTWYVEKTEKTSHFATFPPKLVEPLIRAGTSEKGCCAQCGAPWRRVVEKTFVPQPDVSLAKGVKGAFNQKPMDASNGWDGVPRGTNDVRTTGWSPGCAHDAAVVPCVVLDPFLGAGTVALVCDRLQRDAIGIELNPAYGAMADARVVDDAPLLAWGAAQLEAAE
jgi:hypothetical protein